MRRLAWLAAVLVAGCAAPLATTQQPREPALSLALTSPANGDATLRFATSRPVAALHFVPDLGTYRETLWQPRDPGFRWVAESGGERLERIDGKAFDRVELRVPQLYQPLPKSYAPFSPYSDGGLLIYSGQFHACAALPCEGEGPLAMRLSAPGRTIRAGGKAGRGTLAYVSEGEGSEIYVGNRAPIADFGMDAILDPGLPEAIRTGLARSLPASGKFFADRYGALSFRPTLFVSIDDRVRADGNESTQGGTLPGQIFMHFNGPHARERLAKEDSAWLDWFFAHEVAHLFQRDGAGDAMGDDGQAWMHEGGADALAALALRDQGEGAYVDKRVAQAANDCSTGLAKGPLSTATARGGFDDHYACGLIAALALDADLRTKGSDLHAFNRAMFAAVKAGAPWSRETWLASARGAGADPAAIGEVVDLTGNDAASAQTALAALAARIPLNPPERPAPGGA